MMFNVSEILEAIGGRLISGNSKTSVLSISTDSRTICKNEAFIAIKGDKFDGHNFINDAIKKGASLIIVNKNFRLDITRASDIPFIRVNDTVYALGEIAKFHRRRFNIPVIALSGSCGKTTTKDMVCEVLSAKLNVLKNEGTFNNFIGLPATLLKLTKDIDIAVVEMGTSHPGEIRRLAEIAHPNVGIITNIGPAHLEFFGSVTNILREKYDLVRGLTIPGLAILNGDDKSLKQEFASEKEKTVFTFGIENKCDFTASRISSGLGRIDFVLNGKDKLRLNVLGRHNVYNALAALACGKIFGISIEKMKAKLANFVLPLTRINFKKIKGYQIIDDSYNSNPLSLECAIEALNDFSAKGRKIVVMGDMLELGEESIALHRLAARKIIDSGIDTLITVGRLSNETAEFVKAHAPRLKVYSCGCSLEARGILTGLLKSDDLILVKGSRAMQMEKAIQDL